MGGNLQRDRGGVRRAIEGQQGPRLQPGQAAAIHRRRPSLHRSLHRLPGGTDQLYRLARFRGCHGRWLLL